MVGGVGVDPGHERQPFVVGELHVLVLLAGEERLDEAAAVGAEFLELRDGGAAEAVGDADERLAGLRRAPAVAEERAEGLDEAVLGAGGGEVEAGLRLVARVAADAAAVEDGLDEPLVAEEFLVTPRRRGRDVGLAQNGTAGGGEGGGGALLGLVAASAAAPLAGQEGDVAAHAAELHVARVEGLEVDGRVDGHGEVGRAVGLDRHRAEHAHGRPGPEAELPRPRVPWEPSHRADLAVEGPADPLEDADVLHGAPGDAVEAVVDVGHVADGAFDLGLDVGHDGRPRPLADGDGRHAREDGVAVNELLVAVDVEQVDGEARGGAGAAVGVGGEEAALGERPRGLVDAAAVWRPALGHG